MIPGAFPIIAGGAKFKALGVNFDGSTWTRRTSNLTGIVDGPVGSLSFWLVIIPNGTFTDRVIFTLSPTITVRIFISGTTGPGLTVLSSGKWSVGKTSLAAGWHHVVVSWQTGPGVNLYVDGVFAQTQSNPSGNFDYTTNPIVFGAAFDGTAPQMFDMAEFWFDPTFIDLSVPANIQKFRSASGKPVNLGANGSKPTGSQPAMYLRGGAANFLTNLGYGGDFTVAAGTLGDSATSPSD